MVLAARIDQEQMDQHEANSKSRNAIFLTCRFLSLIEFLTLLRLERSGKPLKAIIRGLPRSRPDPLRRTNVSMRTLFGCLESLSILCSLASSQS